MKLEEILQIAVADYLRLQYPKALWWHTANERKAKVQYNAKLKRMGVKRGVVDILIFEDYYKAHICGAGNSYEQYKGFAIELKIPPNKPTPSQYEVMALLEMRGWKTAVCYNFDEAKEVIDGYLK